MKSNNKIIFSILVLFLVLGLINSVSAESNDITLSNYGTVSDKLDLSYSNQITDGQENHVNEVHDDFSYSASNVITEYVKSTNETPRIYVNGSYTGDTEDGSQANPYKDIASAVTNANSGDEIFICNGDYTIKKTLTFDKSLSLVGEGNNVNINFVSNIYTQTKGDNNNFTFSNLNFKGYNANAFTGALTLNNKNGYSIIKNCNFVDNRGKYLITSSSKSTILDNCTFDGCTFPMTQGSVISFSGLSSDPNNPVVITIKNCIFRNINQTNYDDSKYNYGIINIQNGYSNVTIENISISQTNIIGNLIRFYTVKNFITAEVKNISIFNNTLKTSSTKGYGNIFYAAKSNFVVKDSIIYNNTLGNSFIYAYNDYVNANFTNNVIYDNELDKYANNASKGNYSADYNWWGSNDKPELNIPINNWFVLTETHIPKTIVEGDDVIVLATFESVKDAENNIVKVNTTIPDINVRFNIQNQGIIRDVKTSNGVAHVIFKPVSGENTVTVTAGNQVLTDTFTVTTNYIYVNNSYEGDISDGSQKFPYKDIATAVKNAHDGDKIFICDGKYDVTSTITLDKSLSFIGESKNVVITFTVNKRTALFDSPYSLTYDCSFDFVNLTFRNIYVGSGSNVYVGAINLRNAGEVNFINCDFFDCNGKYLIWSDSTDFNMENCTIKSFEFGSSNGALIYLSGKGNSTIKNTIFGDVLYEGSGIVNGAVHLQNGNATCILDNITISNFNIVGAGVLYGSTSRNTVNIIVNNSKIINNKIYKNSRSGGFLFTLSNANLIIENTVVANNYCDVAFINQLSNSNSNLSYNVIYDNELDKYANNPSKGNYSADYNWWGSNNPNLNIPINNWVILDMIVESESQNVGDEVNVIADLTKYIDNNGNTVKLNRTLPNVSVIFDIPEHDIHDEIETENGIANITFNLKDGNNNIEISTGKQTLHVNIHVGEKQNPDIGVDVSDIKFGEDAVITVSLPSDATGNVVITVDGKDYTVAVVDGKATQVVKDLVAGDYTVAVKYDGDDNYNAAEVTKDINVAKADAVLNVIIADVNYNNKFTIESTLTGVNNAPLTGNVVVTVNGKDYTVAVVDGKGILTGDKLDVGTYDFVAVWAGNDNYNAVNANGNFKVNKIDSTIDVDVSDIKFGEDAVITVSLPSGATGNVVITVDGKDYTVAIVDGKATQVVKDLAAGDYAVTVKYGGDDKYVANQSIANFTVSKISDYNMDIFVSEIKEGENSTIGVDLPKDATGTVTVEIDGEKYTANVINGTANVIIFGLSAGDYNITTTYSGDDNYVSMSKKGNITVIWDTGVNLDVNDVVMIYHDGSRLVAKLTDFQGKPIANATLYFTINGRTYPKTTDANGTAFIGLNLDSNVYTSTISYNGSDKYNAVSKNITVTINPTVLADDLVKMYKNATKFSAKFTDSTGKVLVNSDVRFNINGVFYTRTTDAYGVASLAINLRPGDYILTAYNPVNGEQKGFNITVKSLIVQNDLTKYYLNASRFQATIYNKDGSLAVNKNVTFNINGVFYIRTTDSNGVVSLAINLRPDDYIITTIFDGLDIGNKVTVLPTLVTKDLNMKYLDGSNFTAQTLDSQGKALANQTVSFNVNGVFYHRITNEDGIASLRIRLISGEYIITSYWNNFQTGNTIKISP